MKLKINSEFKEQAMSHGNVCRKTLEQHNDNELLELAIMARTSNNPILLRCFDINELPSLKDLKEEKMKLEQEEISKNTIQIAPSMAKTTLASNSKPSIPEVQVNS